MSIKLVISGFYKNSMDDHYLNGSDNDTSNNHFIDLTITAKDQEELISNIKEYLDFEEYQIDPCEDEPNRLNFEILECAEGSRASPLEIQLWKEGKGKLYHCNYSCYVEIVKPYELIK